jgi:hypothetical protein
MNVGSQGQKAKFRDNQRKVAGRGLARQRRLAANSPHQARARWNAADAEPREARSHARAATQGREGLQDRQINRIGRRTVLAMLLTVAIVAIWKLLNAGA